jgi:diketogulonate reductase-like aldo/keto reductase
VAVAHVSGAGGLVAWAVQQAGRGPVDHASSIPLRGRPAWCSFPPPGALGAQSKQNQDYGQQGIAFLPFSPLGRGFLTGRFSSFDDLPQNDFRRRLPRFQRDALRANLAIVGQVRQIAERAEATPAQVALAWVLAQGQHVVPIPGTKTPKYLADNAGAADIQLSAADLAELDARRCPDDLR